MSAIFLSPPASLNKALFPEKTPRVIAAVGGGGKTTFLKTLAAELQAAGASVILTTTTKVRPPEDLSLLAQGPEEAAAILTQGHIPLVGRYITAEKLQGLPGGIAPLMGLADYILVEADGSRKRPLKMTNPTYEPVIPPEAEAVVALAGLDALGQPLSRSVHRPELAGQALTLPMDHLVTPETVARLLDLCYQPRYVLCNKADDPLRQRSGLEIAARLPGARCVITSLRAWGLAETR